MVSYQSPSGCDDNPSAAHFLTEEMNKSRVLVLVAMAAVQISQSNGACYVMPVFGIVGVVDCSGDLMDARDWRKTK